MTVYVTATSSRPTVACPAWCEVTQEQHVADLPNWDGRAVHQWHVGFDSPGLQKFDLSVGVSLCVDGTPDDHERNAPTVIIEGREYDLDEASEVAHGILALIADVSRA